MRRPPFRLRPAPRGSGPVAFILACAFVLALAAGPAAAPARAAAPILDSNASAYLAGEDIVIRFAHGPGNALDWIGIYPLGVTPDGSPPATAWQFADGTMVGTRGVREGSVTFAGGLSRPGDWAVHLFLANTFIPLTTHAFKVTTPNQPAIRLPQRILTTGQRLEVAFTNGPGHAKDWIGIYPVNEVPDGNPLALMWRYVDGTIQGAIGRGEGTVAFPQGLAVPGTYAAHLLREESYQVVATETFTVVARENSPPRVTSVSPPQGADGLLPPLTFFATLTNGSSRVVPSSILLTLDAVAVPALVTQDGGLTTVTYTHPVFPEPGSRHTWRLTAADDATPPLLLEEITEVGVAEYRNVTLPAPLYFESFDALAEGTLPEGWTASGHAPPVNPTVDFGDLGSAAYRQWTAVEVARFAGPLVAYGDPEDPAGPTTDYRRVLSANPLNVLNGEVLTGPLASGRMLFANSGYHNAHDSQVLTLFTRAYDFSGKTNVHLAFRSLWEQSEDSLAAVEYSVDGGASWLPVAYFLDAADLVMVPDGPDGEPVLDAVATFTTEHEDIARVPDEDGNEIGGTYGAFIGAPVSPALAPSIQARVPDDPVESKRVEVYRLPAADLRGNVRFRFTHVGADSWYWGLDDFGLYAETLPPPPPGPLVVTFEAGRVVVVFEGVLQSAPDAAGPWTEVDGAVSPYSAEPAVGARFFRTRAGSGTGPAE